MDKSALPIERIREIAKSELRRVDPSIVILPMPPVLPLTVLSTDVNPVNREGVGFNVPLKCVPEQLAVALVEADARYFFNRLIVPIEPGLGCALEVSFNETEPWYGILVCQNIPLNWAERMNRVFLNRPAYVLPSLDLDCHLQFLGQLVGEPSVVHLLSDWICPAKCHCWS